MAVFPSSYLQAGALFTRVRFASKGKPLAGNTRLFEDRDGASVTAYRVRLHETDIVTFHAGGTITLSTGGWLTVTTKARMNDCLPAGWRVASDKGRWMLYGPAYTVVPFADGITLNVKTGEVTGGAAQSEVEVQDAHNKAADKVIRQYLALLTPESVRAAVADMGGDCWLCAAEVYDLDHLRSHVHEGYVVGTLLVRAVQAAGARPEVWLGGYLTSDVSTVKRWTRKYLTNATRAGAVASGSGHKHGASARVWQRG